MKDDGGSTSSDDDSVLDETDNLEKQRSKRWTHGIEWCGVVDESPSTTLQWPPPDASPSTSSGTIDLRHIQFGNQMFGQKMQLYSKTGFFLAVYPDGVVRGTQDPNDLHTDLELINAGHVAHVRIKGTQTNQYVAMSEKGMLYADFDERNLETVFKETLVHPYNVYVSKHFNWYIGIKKSGMPKQGPSTKLGQKAVMFLPRRTKFG